MSIRTIMRAAIEAGCSIDQIEAIVTAAEEAKEDAEEQTRIQAEAVLDQKRAQKRAGNAERQRRSRMSRRDGALRNVTERDPSPPPAPSPEPPTPPAPTPVHDPLLPSEAAPKGCQRKAGSALPTDWQPKERHFDKAAEWGLSEVYVRDQAEELENWAIANANSVKARKSDWDRTFSGFLSRGRSQALADIKYGRRPELKYQGAAVASNAADPRIDFGGGISAPLSNVLKRVEQGKWERDWRGRPGENDCVIPQEFWPAILAKKSDQPQGLFQHLH